MTMELLRELIEISESDDKWSEVSLEQAKKSTKGLYYRRTPHQPWQKCPESHVWNAHFYYAVPKKERIT
jgi:hypothetical protein